MDSEKKKNVLPIGNGFLIINILGHHASSGDTGQDSSYDITMTADIEENTKTKMLGLYRG